MLKIKFNYLLLFKIDLKYLHNIINSIITMRLIHGILINIIFFWLELKLYNIKHEIFLFDYNKHKINKGAVFRAFRLKKKKKFIN